MMIGAQRALLSGGRWHFQHGPIDIVIHAEGQADALQAAHQAAWGRFETMLAELVAELPTLRLPVAGLPQMRWPLADACPVQGVIARRMWDACAPLVDDADGYLTPMAAVAGSVAQELVACYQRPGIERALINNGGDIALHLAPGTQARVGLYADLARFDAAAATRTAAGRLRTDLDVVVHAFEPVRGVATSGWRGRSHSRGIADSVTVLAATAAMADAAATVVANAVDLADGHQAAQAGIVRLPANSQRDNSDLGTIAVTVNVPSLPAALVLQALQRGLACARRLQGRGLLQAALLVCQGSLVRLPASVPLRSLPQLVQ